jgi:uncharacterized RDD family membrane protein YckC
MGIPFFALLTMIGAVAAIQSGGVLVLLMLAYAIWALTLFSRGTTPGKNFLGMEVIDEHGRRATFWRMLAREWIGKAISGLVFGLGYVWILIDRDRQGWHDKLVSTYVVNRTQTPTA